MKTQVISTLMLGFGLAQASAGPVQYKVDPAHSSVGFSVRHMMVSNVRGEFTDFEAAVVYSADDLQKSSVSATVKTTSIDTANSDRDNHLRSADFFDSGKYPEMKFSSTAFHRKGGKLYIDGSLTIADVTRSVTLSIDEGPTAPIQDPWGNERVGLVATTVVNRTDFGLKWNQVLEAGGVLVGEEVKITLDLSLIRQAASDM